MNRTEFLHDYWRYYLMLEKKFINTLNYVELSTDNYAVYSDEFANLLQSAGAELDAFFKVFCNLTSGRPTISDYASCILSNYPEVTTQEVNIHSYGITFKPFGNWKVQQSAKSLTWWDAFTSIKHNRIAAIRKASLENVMNIMGALCFLEMKYLLIITQRTDEVNVPDEESAIFTLKDWPRNFMNSVGFEVTRDDNGKEAIIIDGSYAQ